MAQNTLIPPELISEIFFHVDNSDKLTISACSQTSSWLRTDMQKKLFSSVKFTYLMGREPDGDRKHFLVDLSLDTPATKFLLSIERNTDFKPWVREFAFEVSAPEERPHVERLPGKGPYSTSLFLILPRLRCLRKFSWHKREEPGQHSIIPFDHWDRHTTKLIRDTLSSRRPRYLIDINLSGTLDIPVNLLLGTCHQLETLEMVSFDLTSVTKETTQPAQPQTLIINRAGRHENSVKGLVRLLETPKSLLNLSKVEILRLFMPGTPLETRYIVSCLDPRTLNQIALMAPEGLPISNAHPAQILDSSANLSGFHNLMDVALFGFVKQVLGGQSHNTPTDQGELAWISNVVRSLPGVPANEPRRRSLYVSIGLLGIPVSLLDSISWELLERALKEKGKDFEEVTVSITVFRCEPPLIDTMHKALESQEGFMSLANYAYLRWEFS
ncbi:hypothetical protein BJ165DRAFT_260304 [Panaeolus papilionaceus]|nr:hypothetical protein BJ165DRAFT_260304 [Panaeolus papilionaceus]